MTPSDRISILFIGPYPPHNAGTMWRVCQFFPFLEDAGFVCTHRPFTSPRLYEIRHRHGGYAEKIALAAAASWCRVVDLTRARNFDLMFIEREVYPFGTPWGERLFHMFNRRLIFTFDDAIYAGHESLDFLPNGWLYRWKYGPGVNWVIRESLHVIVGNRFLARHARQFNPRVSIVPTVVDTDRFQPGHRSDVFPIRIGWMGSQSTSPYLRPLLPVFQQLASRYGEKIEFHIQGDPEFPKFDRAVIRDYHFDPTGDDFRSFDIGIMPMPDNEWTRGKCGFKAIQYMAVGTAAIASPVGMVDELIEDGKNGLLAGSPSEWMEKLSLLIENEELRRRLGAEGRKKVEQDFSLKVWAPRFVELLRSIHNSAGRPAGQRAATI